MLSYGICLSLLDLLHLVWYSLGPSVLLQMALFCSFLWLSNIPLCVCVCVCLNLSLCICTHTDTHHLFFIHFSLDGHLDCCHVLAIVNCAAINNGVHVSFWITIFSRSSVLKSNYLWDSQCKGLREVGVLLGMSLKIKYSHLRRHL